MIPRYANATWVSLFELSRVRIRVVCDGLHHVWQEQEAMGVMLNPIICYASSCLRFDVYHHSANATYFTTTRVTYTGCLCVMVCTMPCGFATIYETIQPCLRQQGGGTLKPYGECVYGTVMQPFSTHSRGG